MENEWQRLETAVQPRLPFETFHWSRAWWQHLATNRRSMRDELWVCALRDGDGTLVAVAPLMRTLRPGRGRLLGMRQLQFFGADPNITEIRGMLCLPGHEAAAYRALGGYLDRCSDEWDWICWTGVAAASQGEAELTRRPRLRLTRELSSYRLELADSWEAFRSGLRRNIKESLRHCYNSLKREGKSFSVQVVCEREELPRAIARFLDLHRRRAGRDDTVHHPDVFASRRAQTFLHDVCECFAADRATHVFALQIDGEVVAMRVAFLLGDTLFLYYSGYDPAWAKYSVMTTLLAEIIKWATEHNVRHLNLSTGSDVSKLRWGPSEALYREFVEISPSFRGRAAFAVFQSAALLRHLSVLRPLRRGRAA